MPLTDLIAPNAILPALKVNNKKQVLQELAARAAVLTGQNERAIFDLLGGLQWVWTPRELGCLSSAAPCGY